MARTLVAMLAAGVFALGMGAAGCAWESGNGDFDAGNDAQNGGDEGLTYPPPPYGNGYGDTVANIQLEKCLCSGNEGTGRVIYLEEFLGSKALLVTVHAGSCYYCAQQSLGMEGMYQKYKDQGLDVMLVLIGDENNDSSRDRLLDFCCEYTNQYGFTFTTAADPGYDTMDSYLLEGTPLNMLLDSQMKIRYRVEALMPETLEGNIEALLAE